MSAFEQAAKALCMGIDIAFVVCGGIILIAFGTGEIVNLMQKRKR